MNAMEKLHKIKEHLMDSFPEREEIVEALMLCLISKQHILLVGPPGTAKSAIISTLAALIDAKYFYYALDKYTVPQELFGPISLKKLEQDIYEKKIEDQLPTAHIGFLDEIFKASTAILNTLLTLMNERFIVNGGRQVDCPLITLVGASNELPTQQEELGAMYDRLLMRFHVNYLKSASNLQKICENEITVPGELIISLADIVKIHTKYASTNVDIDFDFHYQIKLALNDAGIIISDRRFKQSRKILKAAAVFNGRTKVEGDDWTWLKFIYWDEPSQIPIITKAVNMLVNPLDQKALEFKDEAFEIINNFWTLEKSEGGTHTQSNAAEAVDKLKRIGKEMDTILETADANKAGKMRTIREEIKVKAKAVVAEAMKI